MGKKSKGGGETQTTVQKADPWVGVQPGLSQLYGSAGDWYRTGGHSTAPTNWGIDQSIAMIKDRSQRGSGLGGYLDQARWSSEDIANQNYARVNPVMTGQMLKDNDWASGRARQDNPYLDSMVKAATRSTRDDFMESIAPSLASQFSLAGRTGSGSHVAAFTGAASKLGERLGDMSANIYGQANEAERSRQYNAYESERSGQRQAWMADPSLRLQASAMAPQFAQQRASLDYMDAGMLQQAGLLERQIRQENMDDPIKRMNVYNTLLQGASGYGTSTSSGAQQQTNPYNRISGTVGGGLMGSMIGPMMGMTGGMGALLGAGLGLFG